MIKEENFPKLNTCLIEISDNLFSDTEFVWVEHLCGPYGDATEWVIEERDGREDDGVTILPAPTVYEMILALRHAIMWDDTNAFADIMVAAAYPDGKENYDDFPDTLLKVLYGKIFEKKIKKESR